eukprot:COSAG01_NODE_54044_length_334_cov_116.723404_1_plen_63_part_01
MQTAHDRLAAPQLAAKAARKKLMVAELRLSAAKEQAARKRLSADGRFRLEGLEGAGSLRRSKE